MAERYDVAARHAEGTAAVERTQSYVWACHLLGYQHPGLTAHASQVRDWYAGEAGLDLDALDRDCAELWAAGTAIEEALRIQREQVGELAAAWAGSAAAAMAGSLQRHCDAANTVVTGVRAAAEGCADLRDHLWQLIDAKVMTAVAIDDRTVAQRAAWVAAAQAVTAGASERQAADEIVHHEITPYVDSAIRVDWLTAMRSTLESVAASYDALTDRLATLPAASFPLPGDPAWSCPVPAGQPVPSVAPATSVAVTPTAAGSSSEGATAVSPAAEPLPLAPEAHLLTTPHPLPTTPETPSRDPIADYGDLGTAPPMPQMAPFGEAGGLPTGPGDLGHLGGSGVLGGLGSLVGRIAEAISGLVGSLAEGLADPVGSDESPLGDPPGVADLVDEGSDGDGSDEDPDDLPEAAKAGELPDDDKATGSAADGPPDDLAEATSGGTASPADSPAPGAPDGPAPGALDGPAPGAPDGPAPGAPDGPAPGAPVGASPPAEPSRPSPPDPQPGGSTPCEIAADDLPQAGR
ncbi:hypothetical protein MSM1_11375 [Mycobacterium sp. SM1]|uniref:hypothetical protein n=1 Tax=Mycobacterium sp. SM1 TaxID=2816243 RepID=UPI001BCD9952|nr:hypothetical protein [Mycobacterium sp. SM1]MBS4728902.1 hypothetical protein [Mycobacterium sp. SM1]